MFMNELLVKYKVATELCHVIARNPYSSQNPIIIISNLQFTTSKRAVSI